MALELEDIKGLWECKAVKDTTRRQIVEYLKKSGRATVDEIAVAAGITSMGIRRHLLALENAGLVRMSVERRPMGRPTHIYELTESAQDLFPKNYHRLTVQLLDGLAEIDGNDKVAKLFERRKEKLHDEYADRMRGKDLEARVTMMAEIMSENGYMAEWEKHEDGYAIVEHNCAISCVAQAYSQACSGEMDLIKSLLGPGVDVTRESHIASGDTCCAYRVREKPARSNQKKSRKSKR